MCISSFEGSEPKIHSSVFLADGAQIIGDVEIGERSSVWFHCTVRGDVNYIRIGKRTNIQDQTVIHVASDGDPTIIGDDVTIGHKAVLHACTVKDRSLIGIGAIVMDGAVIEEDCIVGAGALVTPGKTFPPRSLITGSPAKVKRPLTEKELEFLLYSSNRYVKLSSRYQKDGKS